MIHAIYILSNDGTKIFVKEYSQNNVNIKELTNFVSAISDFSDVFSENKKDNGFSSFVLGENTFIFHKDKEFTIIATVDAELDKSDMSKFKKIYKKFRDNHDTIIINGIANKSKLKEFEIEILKIVEGSDNGIINFQAIEDLLWNSLKNPLK
ncbi:MAG: hypothetical protein ACETWM_07455 [Candidatus Lokiarchaeia archaeon]